MSFQVQLLHYHQRAGKRNAFRNADDVKRLILPMPHKGNKNDHLFFADDNFARNKNWEEILDMIIRLRNENHIEIKFGVQVDTRQYKIRNFAAKLKAAGCRYVFIGVESITLRPAKSWQETEPDC